MKISLHTPKLTSGELNRFWLSPSDACYLAGIGEGEKPEGRRFLNNVSDRGLVPFEKSGNSKTAPRLYSLKSCAMLRVMQEITESGCSYEYAYSVASEAGNIFNQIITTNNSKDDISEYDWMLCYETKDKSSVENLHVIREGELEAARLITATQVGVVALGSITWNLLHRYPDYWARNRIERGLDLPTGQYEGTDTNGDPLDISNPWYKELSPIERAKRMVEIEEYIESLNKESNS